MNRPEMKLKLMYPESPIHALTEGQAEWVLGLMEEAGMLGEEGAVTPPTRVKRVCLGFGPAEGRCEEPAGCPHSPYWCAACNELRMEHIARQLERMVQPDRRAD